MPCVRNGLHTLVFSGHLDIRVDFVVPMVLLPGSALLGFAVCHLSFAGAAPIFHPLIPKGRLP
jgi:hypothetical protein